MSLGHGGAYSVNYNGGDDIFVKGRPDLIDVPHKMKVWFGYNNSWIAECSDHFEWNLKGCYVALEKVLKGNCERSPKHLLVCIYNFYIRFHLS